MLLHPSHRAAYVLHSRLSGELKDRHVYYVVVQVSERDYRVLMYFYEPTAPKVTLLPPCEGEALAFRANGLNVERMDVAVGRHRDLPARSLDVRLICPELDFA